MADCDTKIGVFVQRPREADLGKIIKYVNFLQMLNLENPLQSGEVECIM